MNGILYSGDEPRDSELFTMDGICGMVNLLRNNSEAIAMEWHRKDNP